MSSVSDCASAVPLYIYFVRMIISVHVETQRMFLFTIVAWCWDLFAGMTLKSAHFACLLLVLKQRFLHKIWSQIYLVNYDLHVMLTCMWCCLACDAALHMMLPCMWCCIACDADLHVMLPCTWCCLACDADMWYMDSQISFDSEPKNSIETIRATIFCC